MKRILSVDWDYFFPDSHTYDVGMSESHGPLVQEILWSHRASCHSLTTKAALLDEYVPTIPKDFWGRVVSGRPERFFVADSHLKLWGVLEPLMFAQVTSLDAHHDCGYNKQTVAAVNCGSWGYWGRKTAVVGRLDLWYPKWRRGTKEPLSGRSRFYRPTTMSYGLPPAAEYDIVFVCRSGAWTPPWYDDLFLRFVNQGDQKCLEDVSPRSITLDRAKELKVHWESQLQSLYRTTIGAGQPAVA